MFQLAACAEMLWPNPPKHWRAARLHVMCYAGLVGLGAFAETKEANALEASRAAFTLDTSHKGAAA